MSCFYSNRLLVHGKHLLFDKQIEFSSWGGGGLLNRGRYGCAASAKPRLGKISRKNPMPEQKSAQEPMTGQIFLNFRVPKTGIFHQVKVAFFTFLSTITHFLSKIAKNLMPGQNLPFKT